jgi:hypothetical protein
LLFSIVPEENPIPSSRKDLGTVDNEATALDNQKIIQAFIERATFTSTQVDLLNYYIAFLRKGSSSRPGWNICGTWVMMPLYSVGRSKMEQDSREE